jgi:hypothetical protein
MTDAKTKYVSRKLAEYFTDDSTPEVRACACLGWSCGLLDCPMFWEGILHESNRDIIKKAFEIVILAREEKK